MILAIRPEPGCSATVAAGAALGVAIEACPLSQVRPLEWSLPAGEFGGLLLGSANALRFGGRFVDKLVDMPVYAVGEMTAAAARAHGFTVARTGRTGLQPLIDELAGQKLRLLRIAGRERVPLSPPTGIAIETAIAYETVPLPLPAPVAERLCGGALVLLHSGAAAAHFAAECDRLAVQRGAIRIAALAPRIAEAAGAGWALVRSAAEPSEPALLALAADMCHEPPSR
jgi:uroporphyrinogen-III synthase